MSSIRAREQGFSLLEALIAAVVEVVLLVGSMGSVVGSFLAGVWSRVIFNYDYRLLDWGQSQGFKVWNPIDIVTWRSN